MTEKTTLLGLISDNSIIGAGGVAAVAFLYKIWRILKTDRKVDNLDASERTFREEMRDEIKRLKEEKHQIEEEKNKLYDTIHEQRAKIDSLEAYIMAHRLSLT